MVFYLSRLFNIFLRGLWALRKKVSPAFYFRISSLGVRNSTSLTYARLPSFSFQSGQRPVLLTFLSGPCPLIIVLSFWPMFSVTHPLFEERFCPYIFLYFSPFFLNAVCAITLESCITLTFCCKGDVFIA